MSVKLDTYPQNKCFRAYRDRQGEGPCLYEINLNYVDEEEMSSPPEREG